VLPNLFSNRGGSLRVRHLLQKKRSDVVTIGPQDAITAGAERLIAHGIGALPVVDAGGSLSGLLSERDIAGAVARGVQGLAGMTVEQGMRHPAPVCAADDVLHDVMLRMTRERLRHLVVLENGRVAGVISVGDLVKHRLDELETEAGVLRDYVAAQRATTSRDLRR
jgi:CBS domain-containing protein